MIVSLSNNCLNKCRVHRIASREGLTYHINKIMIGISLIFYLRYKEQQECRTNQTK